MSTPTRMRYELPLAQDVPIWDIWLSMHYLPAMAVADEIGIFEALGREPATVDETAQRLGLNKRAMGVLSAMLSALDLFVIRNGRYELAEVTRTYLLPESPYYWGPLLRSLGVLPNQRAALLRALRAVDDSDAISAAPVPSKSWETGQVDRAQAEAVSSIMHCHSLPASIGAVRSGSLDGVARLLDVGGGSGCFSIAMAQHFPEVRCTVMDLPAVCEVAQTYIEAGGVSDRVDTCSLNMFNGSWPTGYDGILFSNVFHDWNSERNLLLARRAHDALPAGGRIFLHEMLLADDGSGPRTAASFSMLMLFGTQGRQYSLQELQRLLTNAGFVDVNAHHTYGYYSLVSARKV